MKKRLILLAKASAVLIVAGAFIFSAVYFAVLIPAKRTMSLFDENGKYALEDQAYTVYGETYYAALITKYDRMKSVTGPKLIVVGGSNIAFGFDSALAESELGIPCINLGLYAALGFDYMLDLALDGAGEGDIILIIPETDGQMYSDYFGADAILRATEGRTDMRCLADESDRYLLASAYPAYFEEKQSYISQEKTAPASGVYASASFNERGDMIFDRPENIMDGYYKSDALPVFDTSIITDTFADMVNGFVHAAENLGATVYFGFPPINSLAAADTTEEQLDLFCRTLEEKLDCRVISSLSDRLLAPGYFYDSNYHCNNLGMIVNTALIITDILRQSGDMHALSFDIPDAPEIADDPVSDIMEENGYFYTKSASGITITGLTDEKLVSDTLELPSEISGFAVTKLADGAFAGCSASLIIIPDGIRTLGGSLFDGAKNLRTVELHQTSLPAVGDMLLSGAPEDILLKVNADMYDTYLMDYFWMGYKDHIIKEN